METKSFECWTAIKGIDERTAQQHASYDHIWQCMYKRLIVAKVLITLICVSNGSVAMAAAATPFRTNSVCLWVRCCYFFITIPIVVPPVSYAYNVVCFSESCFLLVLSYGFEWASVSARWFVYDSSFGNMVISKCACVCRCRDIRLNWRMSCYFTNVTNLTRTRLVRQQYYKHFYSFSFVFFFRVSFIRVTIYWVSESVVCVLLLFVLLLNHDCMFARVWFSLPYFSLFSFSYRSLFRYLSPFSRLSFTFILSLCSFHHCAH